MKKKNQLITQVYKCNDTSIDGKEDAELSRPMTVNSLSKCSIEKIENIKHQQVRVRFKKKYSRHPYCAIISRQDWEDMVTTNTNLKAAAMMIKFAEIGEGGLE